MRRIAPPLIAALIITLFSCATEPEVPQQNPAELYPPDRPFPESRFATVGTVRVHYRLWQPDEEPKAKLLLLHGLGASTYSFDAVVSGLIAEGYAVAAVDMPGFGFSDPALKFEHTPENRLALMWTLVDRLDTDQNQFNPVARWYIVGHQMGGEFACWMALDRPGRVAGLVLVSTVLGTNRPAGKMAWFPPVLWGFRSWLTNTLFTREGVQELLEKAYGRPPSPDAVNGCLAPLLRDDAERALVRYVRTAGPQVPPFDAITRPVLHIWGSEDSWRSLEEAREQVGERENVTFRIIEGAGHIPMDTHPEQFTTAVDSWITGLPLNGM